MSFGIDCIIEVFDFHFRFGKFMGKNLPNARPNEDHNIICEQKVYVQLLKKKKKKKSY